LNWLAAAHHATGDYAAGAPLLRRALEIEFETAAEILPALLESEGLEYIQGTYGIRDLLLENARRMKNAARDVYPFVWKSRALVTRLVGRPRLDSATAPASAKTWNRCSPSAGRSRALVWRCHAGRRASSNRASTS
jgi:hypothetical protein